MFAVAFAAVVGHDIATVAVERGIADVRCRRVCSCWDVVFAAAAAASSSILIIGYHGHVAAAIASLRVPILLSGGTSPIGIGSDLRISVSRDRYARHSPTTPNSVLVVSVVRRVGGSYGAGDARSRSRSYYSTNSDGHHNDTHTGGIDGVTYWQTATLE